MGRVLYFVLGIKKFMGPALLLIAGLMIAFCVVMFFVGLAQKAKRRNDGLAQKSKLLEMYAAEEKEREEQEKLKESQKKQSEE
ncbi:MAG: hypothetical protein E7616_02280 [Ruminococcaceae bacterium]|nr:hypothetical protein [Oscillospiraceae bacterium]